MATKLVGRVITPPHGTTPISSAPGAELAGVTEDSIVELHLDVPHEEYYRAELVYPPPAGGKSLGWIAKSRVELLTPLSGQFEYVAQGDDEVGFAKDQVVYGIKQIDEWWEGINLDQHRVGMFPGNYVKELPLPRISQTPPRPQPPPPTPAAAAVALKPIAPMGGVKPPPPKAAGPSDMATTQNPLAKGGAPPPSRRGGGDDRFTGYNQQQYSIWAHEMTYHSAFTSFGLGLFTVVWVYGVGYECKIEDRYISSDYIYNASYCAAMTNYTGDCCPAEYCCHPNEFKNVNLHGSIPVGVAAMIVSILALFFENQDWGYGLWQPTDWSWYERKVSPHAIVYFIFGVVCLPAFPSAFAGVCWLITAYVYQHSFSRQEAGDGGRKQRAAAKERKLAAKARPKSTVEDGYPSDWYRKISVIEICTNPIAFYRKLVREDKLTIYCWLAFYFFLNIFIFFFTLAIWVELVNTTQEDLWHGRLKVACGSDDCLRNRNIVRHGFPSDLGPYAKACGACLNFNCALIVMPVTKLLLSRLNNLGMAYTKAKPGASVISDCFGRFFAAPFTRYVPVSKNIEFHKLIAIMIFIYAWIHTLGHFANYAITSVGTLNTFAKFGWGGTTFLTGFIILLAQHFIYSAASDRVKRAKYENFFFAHNWFIVFFVFLFLHGPVFYAWAILPLTLYFTERMLQLLRGSRPFLVTRVEWVKPVLALYMCPLDRSSFIFREGQYLYLSCPYINRYEWHPFTISSARGDLSIAGGPSNPLRVATETGEEVVEVPRPARLPAQQKWAKYCPVSSDYTTLQEWELLDKHETCYHDYVSVHIKVHGLDDFKARSWTRRFKEYIELMCPGQNFPYHFSSRDARGDLILGRRLGVDNQPIIRVDGPHAAPAELYVNYKTVMVVGAGIGMTPCASVLTAMLKYRWRFGQPPEKLHFYWVVQHGEVDAFQWFIHLITELEHIHYKQKCAANTEQARADWRTKYCEIHMYITRAPKQEVPVPEMVSASKFIPVNEDIKPQFTVEQLYGEMYNPSTPSKSQNEMMANPTRATNRLQDVWVWNGRPDWDQTFQTIQKNAVDPNIGVFFCGAPVIGSDLQTMCQKYSVDRGVTFHLHKENF